MAPFKAPFNAVFAIVFQWPISVVLLHRQKTGNFLDILCPYRWGLHNLLPLPRLESVLYDDSDVNLLLADDKELVANLLLLWPTYVGLELEEAIKFWKHELSKHGSASGMNPKEYFETAIRISRKFHEDGLLATIEENPANNIVRCGSYSKSELERLFSFEVQVSIKSHAGSPIINELKIFLDSNLNTIPGRCVIVGYEQWDTTLVRIALPSELPLAPPLAHD